MSNGMEWSGPVYFDIKCGSPTEDAFSQIWPVVRALHQVSLECECLCFNFNWKFFVRCVQVRPRQSASASSELQLASTSTGSTWRYLPLPLHFVDKQSHNNNNPSHQRNTTTNIRPALRAKTVPTQFGPSCCKGVLVRHINWTHYHHLRASMADFKLSASLEGHEDDVSTAMPYPW